MLAAKFTAAPYFALPHTNKCASGEPGEPNATTGGPNPNSGTHTATAGINLLLEAEYHQIGYIGIMMMMFLEMVTEEHFVFWVQHFNQG